MGGAASTVGGPDGRGYVYKAPDAGSTVEDPVDEESLRELGMRDMQRYDALRERCEEGHLAAEPGPGMRRVGSGLRAIKARISLRVNGAEFDETAESKVPSGFRRKIDSIREWAAGVTRAEEEEEEDTTSATPAPTPDAQPQPAVTVTEASPRPQAASPTAAPSPMQSPQNRTRTMMRWQVVQQHAKETAKAGQAAKSGTRPRSASWGSSRPSGGLEDAGMLAVGMPPKAATQPSLIHIEIADESNTTVAATSIKVPQQRRQSAPAPATGSMEQPSGSSVGSPEAASASASPPAAATPASEPAAGTPPTRVLSSLTVQSSYGSPEESLSPSGTSRRSVTFSLMPDVGSDNSLRSSRGSGSMSACGSGRRASAALSSVGYEVSSTSSLGERGAALVFPAAYSMEPALFAATVDSIAPKEEDLAALNRRGPAYKLDRLASLTSIGSAQRAVAAKRGLQGRTSS